MEENKVAIKLKEIVHDAVCCGSSSYKPCEYLTEKLLQSPDLRVTLVEPRYKIHIDYVIDTRVDLSIAKFLDDKRASEYCAWLNSKEPK